MLDNEDRATLGADAIHAAGRQTGVTEQDVIATAITDVLAYVAHFCDRVGLDPEQTFASGISSYEGDFEDGPRAAKRLDGSESFWNELGT